MKTYVKPTVDVVELSVRENMADLPSGVITATGGVSGYYGNDKIATTVYDLTATSSSVSQGTL